MKTSVLLGAACLAVTALALPARDAAAFRMVQNNSAGRTSTGTRVACDDPNGFTHRTSALVAWRLNTASQGAKPGVVSAFQNALAAWNGVAGGGYTLSWAGTTTAGFATDGINTALWSVGNGCSGGCLAITALVLGPGQVIQEADISFNDAATWNTNGGDFDVQSIAVHELGHSLGIHHTELKSKHNRPTMYASYIGTDGRSLESDDRAALVCSNNRYPPAGSAAIASVSGDPAQPGGPGRVRLVSRSREGGATLRFALDETGPVRLEVFDLAGRRLATLANGESEAGEHELAWAGATASGKARPGLYFARLTTSRGEGHATVLLDR